MLSLLATHTVQGAEVEQDVNQGVLIGDCLLVAESGALNPQSFGQGIDALGSSPLLIDLLVEVAVPIELIADTSAGAGGQLGDATALSPLLVIDGAG